MLFGSRVAVIVFATRALMRTVEVAGEHSIGESARMVE